MDYSNAYCGACGSTTLLTNGLAHNPDCPTLQPKADKANKWCPNCGALFVNSPCCGRVEGLRSQLEAARKQIFDLKYPKGVVSSFWNRTERKRDTECWPWIGTVADGYGHINRSVSVLAHRLAYELLRGPIPDGLQLDHLCRNRRCVNPAHLEPVTPKENIARGVRARITACPKGHPYDEQNTRLSKGNKRVCRECDRARAKRNFDRKKAAAHV